jgi:hypothetical protein
MATFSNKIMPKLCPRFYCEKCDYGTSKKSSFNNHCQSIKHNGNTLATKLCPNYARNKNVAQQLFPKSKLGFSKMDKKMSKIENPIYFLEKKCKNQIVTKMLSFSFLK